MDKETFLTKEKKLAKLILNSRKNNRLSSAYLFCGPRNAPLKECALYLAQSLGCENSLLACNECNSCKRFLKGIHPDFILIDGEKKRIKKEDIQNLEEKFSQSAFENKHQLCYIIHHIENITEKAANTILKFLEEPKEGQIAILTTTNPDKVLPTIRSRSLMVDVDPIDIDKMRESLESYPLEIEGKKKKEVIHLSSGHAYFLSKFFPSKEAALNELMSDNSFLTGFEMAEQFFEEYLVSRQRACFMILNQSSQKKGASCYNWMYLMMHDIFVSARLKQNSENHPFHEVIQALSLDLKHVEKADDVVKEALSYAHVNYNPILIGAKIAYSFIQE